MGNVHSLSSEAALCGIVIIGGAVYYSYTQSPSLPTHTPPTKSTSSTANKKGKKKNSKKSASAETDPSPKEKARADPIVVPFPTILPGQFDADSIASDDQPASQSKKSKKKKAKAKDKSAAAGVSSAESSTPVPPSKPKPKSKRSSPSDPSTSKSTLKSAPSIDTGTDGSWTRVEPHNRKAKHATEGQHQPSLSGTMETETGDSSSIAEKATDEDKDVRAGWGSNEHRKTLAEKLLPKPRKTAVDDMLETPDYPALSRVMRVQPRPDEKPASGFSWADYEDVRIDAGTASGSGSAEAGAGGLASDADGDDDGEADDNDGWGVVKGRGRSKPNQSYSSQFQSASQQKTSSSSAEQTKRQRQNAAKREAQKAAKASTEADRLATLAKHKRELERAKMVEQFASGGGGKGGKTSGGMKASVDANGKLVWE